MVGIRQCFRVGQTLRRFTTNQPARAGIQPEEYSAYKKLKANQELFQREDTIEDVYIKGGPTQVILFKIITGLTVVGVLLDGTIIYRLATESF